MSRPIGETVHIELLFVEIFKIIHFLYKWFMYFMSWVWYLLRRLFSYSSSGGGFLFKLVYYIIVLGIIAAIIIFIFMAVTYTVFKKKLKKRYDF